MGAIVEPDPICRGGCYMFAEPHLAAECRRACRIRVDRAARAAAYDDSAPRHRLGPPARGRLG